MSAAESRVLVDAIGNVTQAPKLIHTASGVPLCRFVVASERGPASNPVQTAVYAKGGLAISCARLAEGDSVGVKGKQRQRTRRRLGVTYPEVATEAHEVELIQGGGEAALLGKLPTSEPRRREFRSIPTPSRAKKAATTASVVHCKHDSYDIYIGRGKDPHTGEPGRWGNPFRIGPDGERAEVIERYRSWLWTQIKSGQIKLAELAALHGKTFGCWCAPEPCHGEVLTAAAAWAAERLD
ncbi:MAG TPA: DUF4326 domain-containing protein [Solirubrobacterales bacterium]|nr:DUF4326 domain-containing protein [Solirubrobacterales bacterium]